MWGAGQMCHWGVRWREYILIRRYLCSALLESLVLVPRCAFCCLLHMYISRTVNDIFNLAYTSSYVVMWLWSDMVLCNARQAPALCTAHAINISAATLSTQIRWAVQGPLGRYIPIPPRSTLFDNRSTAHMWRDTWQSRECLLLHRLTQQAESRYPNTQALPRLQAHDTVLIQNQSGPNPNEWDRAGRVVELLPHDQCLIRVNGSGRITRHNRRYLCLINPPTNVTSPGAHALAMRCKICYEVVAHHISCWMFTRI